MDSFESRDFFGLTLWDLRKAFGLAETAGQIK